MWCMCMYICTCVCVCVFMCMCMCVRAEVREYFNNEGFSRWSKIYRHIFSKVPSPSLSNGTWYINVLGKKRPP